VCGRINSDRTPGAGKILQSSTIKPERRCLLGDRRHYAFIAVALLTLPVCAGNDQCAYLPAVGPSPLRFFAPLAPPVKTFTPPPPPAPEPPKPVKVELPPPTPPPAAVIPEPAAVTNQAISGFSQPAQPEEVVSPQMLLKYFNKSSSSNGVSATVIAPLDFTPPKPAEAPSSKATYTIGP
jgi:hypothetical protein